MISDLSRKFALLTGGRLTNFTLSLSLSLSVMRDNPPLSLSEYALLTGGRLTNFTRIKDDSVNRRLLTQLTFLKVFYSLSPPL